MAGPVNERALRWLRSELPELVTQGILTPEAAAALDRHYREKEKAGSSFGFILLAVIGSVLVGAGIILLIAHNWDDLSRGIRCVLAFLPLTAALILGGFVLLRRNESTAWRESVAILDIASVGTAIALVSQIFQIQGSFADFMRVWLILSIPIVYLFRSRVVELAYLIGTAVFVLSLVEFWGYRVPGRLQFWLLFALAVPFYLSSVGQFSEGWMQRVLALAVVGAASIGLGATVDLASCGLGGVAFAGLFAIVYLIGMEQQKDPNRPLTSFTALGGIGIAVTATLLSFKGMWSFNSDLLPKDAATEQRIAVVIVLTIPVASLLLAVWCKMRDSGRFSYTAVAVPFVALIARFILPLIFDPTRTYPDCSFAAAFVFNVYVLALGAVFLVRGIRANSVARANFGLLVIAALALCRFFDTDLSFVVRGLGFIAVGAGFLVANLVFFRRTARA